MNIIKILVWGTVLFALLLVIGTFPPLTVAITAISIVFLFLVFGKQ